MSEKKKVMIVPGGPDMDAVAKAIAEMQASSLSIITPESYKEQAEKCKASLEKQMQVKIITLQPDFWEQFFAITRDIASIHEGDDGEAAEVVMFTTTGDCELRSIATTAAFANGLKALSYDNKKLRLLPFFKFNYYSALTDKKMEILKILEEDITCCKSLEELSQRTKMSLPLISYHVNGNLKSEGLKKMGLVETREERGKIIINLSTQGRMLLQGILDQDKE